MNSSELRGFLTGLILGDGRIDKGVSKRAFSINSISPDFTDMIFLELTKNSPFKLKFKFIPEHYSSGCNHKDAWLITVPAHPYFAKMYHHFYSDTGKRVISPIALRWLNECGLANWYMCDGYCTRVGVRKGNVTHRRIEFATDRYDYETVCRVRDYMKERFDLVCSVAKHGNVYRLRVLTESYETFLNLVRPYIVPDMLYKLNLMYEHKPNWMSDELWEFQRSLSSTVAQTGNAVG